MKFVEHMLIAIIWIAVAAAGAWFGAPLIYKHFLAAEGAVQTVAVQQGALQADTAAANRQQSACMAAATSAAAAARAVTRAAQVQSTAPGKPQPLVTSDDIKAMMQ